MNISEREKNRNRRVQKFYHTYKCDIDEHTPIKIQIADSKRRWAFKDRVRDIVDDYFQSIRYNGDSWDDTDWEQFFTDIGFDFERDKDSFIGIVNAVAYNHYGPECDDSGSEF